MYKNMSQTIQTKMSKLGNSLYGQSKGYDLSMELPKVVVELYDACDNDDAMTVVDILVSQVAFHAWAIEHFEYVYRIELPPRDGEIGLLAVCTGMPCVVETLIKHHKCFECIFPKNIENKSFFGIDLMRIAYCLFSGGFSESTVLDILVMLVNFYKCSKTKFIRIACKYRNYKAFLYCINGKELSFCCRGTLWANDDLRGGIEHIKFMPEPACSRFVHALLDNGLDSSLRVSTQHIGVFVGSSPSLLHVFVYSKRKQTCELLMDRGACLNCFSGAGDGHWHSPLGVAGCEYNIDMVYMLANMGADPWRAARELVKRNRRFQDDMFAIFRNLMKNLVRYCQMPMELRREIFTTMLMWMHDQYEEGECEGIRWNELPWEVVEIIILQLANKHVDEVFVEAEANMTDELRGICSCGHCSWKDHK